MFEVLDEVCNPTKGSEFSACVDLYAREDVTIGAGETVLVPLGVKICEKLLNEVAKEKIDYGDKEELFIEWFKKSHQLNLHIRSSMSAKHGLIIANGTGVIDLDYEDEIMICLHCPIAMVDYDYGDNIMTQYSKGRGKSKHREYFVIKKGQKIAQISLVEHKSYLMGIETKDKRTGGFGSSDKNDISHMLDDVSYQENKMEIKG